MADNMDLIELGQAIATTRRAQKLTQAALAQKSGLSRVTINQLEQGRISDLGIRKLLNILNILNLTLKLSEPDALPTLDDLIKERYHDA